MRVMNLLLFAVLFEDGLEFLSWFTGGKCTNGSTTEGETER
jgi:hypothetical protein